MEHKKLQENIHIALMAALLCILAPFTFPLPFTPIPVSCATLAIYFIAGLLGPFKSTKVILLYLFLGAVGLPVFSGFEGGFQKFLSPTGGYLIGYLFLGFLSGLAFQKWENHLALKTAGLIGATAVCYIFGTILLALHNHLSFFQALLLGVIPFLPGDGVKILLSVLFCPLLKKYLSILENSHS